MKVSRLFFIFDFLPGRPGIMCVGGWIMARLMSKKAGGRPPMVGDVIPLRVDNRRRVWGRRSPYCLSPGWTKRLDG